MDDVHLAPFGLAPCCERDFISDVEFGLPGETNSISLIAHSYTVLPVSYNGIQSYVVFLRYPSEGGVVCRGPRSDWTVAVNSGYYLRVVYAVWAVLVAWRLGCS